MKSTEDFIKTCIQKHGDCHYDYTDSIYSGWNEYVNVHCNVHNSLFCVKAGEHQRGRNCPECVKDKMSTIHNDSQEIFEAKTKLVHKDRYDLSLAEYKNNKTLVELICKEHGSFWQTPTTLYRGSGCQKCGYNEIGNKLRSSTEEWIEKAVKIHGAKYDYTLAHHTSKTNKITIHCKTCNTIFKQRPTNHLNKSGCPVCVINGYNQDKSGNLYVLLFENVVKVGITNRKVQTRLREICNSSGYDFEVIFQQNFEDGSIPYNIESKLKTYLSDQQRVTSKFDGSTECFISVDIDRLLLKIKELQDDSN